MREKGQVSLWLGKAESDKALRQALVVNYSEDGDFLGSAFSQGFLLGRYDDARREALRHKRPPKDLRKLLGGISYESNVVSALEGLGVEPASSDNCFVLLYDYRFNEPVGAQWRISGLDLRFAGCAQYSPTKP